MYIGIDFQNYAPWYNTLALLLLTGSAAMAWSWTIRGLVSLAHGPHGLWVKATRGLIYGGIAVFLATWVFYGIMLTSHLLTGWPKIY